MSQSGVKKGKYTQVEIIYEYYKQQREEYRHLAKERSTLSLQLLVIHGALLVAFYQAGTLTLKVGISVFMVALGMLGIMILANIERSMTLHVERSRAARDSLEFLDEFVKASKYSDFPETFLWSGIRRDRLF